MIGLFAGFDEPRAVGTSASLTRSWTTVTTADCRRLDRAGSFFQGNDFPIEQQPLIACLAISARDSSSENFSLNGQIEGDQDFTARQHVRAVVGQICCGESFCTGWPHCRQCSARQCGQKNLRVIGDLRHRADRGAGGFDGVALFDGDGGGNAFDAVRLGLVHAVEELAGIGRKGLDIAALALGKEGVKGQGTLARAAQAGDDDQLAERHVEIEVFQVVLPDAPQADAVLRLRRHDLKISGCGRESNPSLRGIILQKIFVALDSGRAHTAFSKTI